MKNARMSIIEKAEKHNNDRREAIERDLEDLKRNERTLKVFANMLNDTLPLKIKSRSEVHFSGYGRYLYANVKPIFGEEFTAHDTILITDWCGSLPEKWRFSKLVNEGSGTWYHKVDRWSKDYNSYYEVVFNTISNIDGCELIETEETKIVKSYKVKC